jgi:poly(hydroxyalkanoate) granule-associated protein
MAFRCPAMDFHANRINKMSDKTIEIEEITEDNVLFESARKLLLGSIGALALGKDEIEALVAKLVERGEVAEQDGRKMVDEITQKGKDTIAKGRERVQSRIGMGEKEEKVVEELPTKADIDTLTEKINELTKKIDAMKNA